MNTLVDELQELFTYAKVQSQHDRARLQDTLHDLAVDASVKQNHALAVQYDLLSSLYKGQDYSATGVRGLLWQLGQLCKDC